MYSKGLSAEQNSWLAVTSIFYLFYSLYYVTQIVLPIALEKSFLRYSLFRFQ